MFKAEKARRNKNQKENLKAFITLQNIIIEFIVKETLGEVLKKTKPKDISKNKST